MSSILSTAPICENCGEPAEPGTAPFGLPTRHTHACVWLQSAADATDRARRHVAEMAACDELSDDALEAACESVGCSLHALDEDGDRYDVRDGDHVFLRGASAVEVWCWLYTSGELAMPKVWKSDSQAANGTGLLAPPGRNPLA